VTQGLAGHRIAKLPRFQEQVLAKVRQSWDPVDRAYTMSFADAADAIVEERAAEAEALGYRPALPAPAARAARPPSLPSRSRAADARTPEAEPWETEDLDDDQIIASIRRDIKAGRLKAI